MGFFSDAGNFFKKAGKTISKGVTKAVDSTVGALKKAMEMIARIPRMIQDAIDAMVEAMIRKPLDGVFTMIENFKRIVCFLESMPKRARNVTSGVGNIFLGVEKKVEAVGKSFSAGFESTGTLFAYSGEYAISRLRCIVQFIQNFYKCVFFYILKSIGGILKIIILKPVEYIGDMFGLNMAAQFERIEEGIITMDQFFYSLLGFHLIYFPESIRKDCFTCVRLKGSAVSKRADEWKHTFDTRIPEIMTEEGGDKEFRRAKNQFTESSVLVPREPGDVQ